MLLTLLLHFVTFISDYLLLVIFYYIYVLIILQRKEADAMAVDGGQVYTAGKCGLVPAMVEQYNECRMLR